MKKLMVIALGMLSNGEITIAMEVLRRLRDGDSKICFVLHEKMSKQVVANGFPVYLLNGSSPNENRDYFYKAVKEFEPDLLLCADVFTMDFSSTWSGIGLKELKDTGIPVGSFDEYEWESTHFIQDFMGIPMQIRGELITDCDYLVRPCPVNRPEQLENRKIINCSLFDVDALLHSYREDIKNKAAWRESLGIPEDSKVIMIVNSTWEYVEVGRSYESGRLIEWIPRIIHNYLLELNESLTVLHVGGKEWSFADKSRIDYRHFTRVNPVDYNCMINCVDLFCGTNLISVTLSRAALCGVPVLLFQNDKCMDFHKLSSVVSRMPEWYQKMAGDVKKVLPFKVFPWGWYRFLEPVMNHNAYDEMISRAPVFQPKKSIEALRRTLFDKTHMEQIKIKRDKYIESLDSLSSPSKIWELM